jgi:YesN/AraC family two-component response regulator
VPRTVLIADDNRLIRDALCKIFEVEHDYELCAQATNGEEAVALAIEHKPDLIILDFAMPVMNGLEAACKLKQIVPKARIILFTVHAGLFKSRKDLPVELVVEKGAPNLMQHVRELIPV